MSDDVLFHEEQLFRRPWLLLLILLIDVPLLAFLILGPPIVLVAGLLPIAIATGLLLAAKLVVDVDSREIRISFHFLWPTRRIAIADVKTAAATHYNALLEYGGWGVRLGWKGWAFNVDGDEGVLVETADGKRVLIGSRRAKELEAAIARALAEHAGGPATP